MNERLKRKRYFETFTKYFQTVATILLTTTLLILFLEGFSFLGITAYHYVSTPEQDVSDSRVNNEVYIEPLEPPTKSF